MKKIILILLPIFISSCWPCKTDPILIENGSLPNEVLHSVPYRQDSMYKFQHSNGLVLCFEASRETYDTYTSCDHCCDYEYHYEINTTTLSTDYPLFDIVFGLNNLDTTYYWCRLSVGKSGFIIPISNAEYECKADSIILGSHVYYDVFKLKSNHYYNNDSIYIDSLYYNYTDGILKLLISNGESYEKVY